MKKIFITHQIPENGLELLRSNGYELDIYPQDVVLSQKKLISLLKKKPYDILLSLLTNVVDAKVFDACPSLKLVANYAVGFNNIDVTEAKNRGIEVSNTPGASSEAVAEHTLALMFALFRRVVESDNFVRRGKYDGWDPMIFWGETIENKTVGIIGGGRIGSRFLEMVSALGMKTMYYDIAINKELEEKTKAKRVETIEELLENADVVSLHVPLCSDTHHLIDKRALNIMKPTAYLINTSRGQVVDEEALVEALAHDKIRGAGLDVFEFEPHLVRGLTSLPNVVLTPHIASAEKSTREDMARVVAENIISFVEKGRPINSVICN